MNYTKQHRMAGHFTKFAENGKYVEDDEKIVVRIVGYNKSNLAQTDINYICSFYHIPWTEKWLIEGQDQYNFKVIISKEETNHD